MAVPSSSLLARAASTTSSGFADGLGRRALGFDREEGTMLERLVLRPELAAFESMLRDRVERVAGLEDERLARPRTIERDADGSLTVVSEFVPGSRLSDLLETSADQGAVPGVDAALGFLLDVLPALCGLHAGAGFAHGTIAPSRIVVTPAGQIVLLDGIFGGALSHLRYGRKRLWTEFGVAAPSSAGAPRLDFDADIAQATLAAVMLVIGRPLQPGEYPDGLPAVMREVVDVAQIRGSADFAQAFEDFLSRALPVPARKPYATADDALFDVRQLAGSLGLHVCRRALVEFIEQMESAAQFSAPGPIDQLADEIESYGLAETDNALSDQDGEQDLEAGVDAEISLDSLGGDAHYDLDEVTEIEIHDDQPTGQDDTEAVDWIAAAAEAEASAEAKVADGTQSIQPAAAEARFAEDQAEPTGSPADLPVPSGHDAAIETTGGTDPDQQAEPAVAAGGPVEPARSGAPFEVPSVHSRRAKRGNRSARARKDKLRSVSAADVPVVKQAVAPPPPSPPPPPQPPKKAASPWLVAPERAAAFEPPLPEPVPEPPPAAAPAPAVIAVRAVPVYAAPPSPSPAPEPVFSRTVGSVAPGYTAAPSWTPPPVAPISVAPAHPQPAPLKMKQVARSRSHTRASAPDADIYSSAAPLVVEPPPSAFPWKLAAAAGVIMIVAIVGGRVYVPAKGLTKGDPTPVRRAATSPAPTTTLPAAGSVGNTGRLEIETQPAGARILIDGKPAGESPVALDGIPAGRHVVTFVSSSGTVRRTVRIEAGRTAKLDVPIFSGWVGIYAPFVVEVSEGGRVIGTTEEPRLMLSPGKHDLTLTNRELGYRSAQSVDIEPGEVRSISLDPRGTVNLNASPWAEVWIDGRKTGDTPIANLQLPLGLREVVFRHPELGEKRVTITVKGDAPAAVSVDMSKPGN